VLQTISRLVPYLLVIAAFTFVYLFIPNTQVRFWPALVGGVAGGIVWQTAGWLFAVFVVSSGQYAAIYSGFAILILILILFMIWLYVSWLVLLFGASVAFYVQRPEYLYLGAGEPRLSNRVRERLALSVMSLVTQRFVSGEPAASLSVFTQLLGVPMRVLERVLEALESRQLLTRSGDDPPLYLLARDPAAISLSEVLGAVRSHGEARFFAPDAWPTSSAVDQALTKMQAAADATLGATSLRALAEQERAAPDEAPLAAHPATIATADRPY
jgi:membrane protein